TALTPDQLAMAATAVSSIGPSKTPVGVDVGLPWGTHAYSPPERLTPQRTTWLPLASSSWFPETWRPEVGLAAATGVAPWSATAAGATRAPIAARARAIRFTRMRLSSSKQPDYESDPTALYVGIASLCQDLYGSALQRSEGEA